MSVPQLFIIESLGLQDEAENLLEGHRLKEMLALSEKQCKYFYIRTERELCQILKEFQQSGYRYLHLSCHGCKDGLSTTFDGLIGRSRLADILNPYIGNRRVFLSACGAATMSLAVRLLQSTECYSLMGPYNSVLFRDAALYWAAFYHLMFKDDPDVMNRERITKHGKTLSRLFGMRMKLFTKNKTRVEEHILR